jgi:hypothetical protein
MTPIEKDALQIAKRGGWKPGAVPSFTGSLAKTAEENAAKVFAAISKGCRMRGEIQHATSLSSVAIADALQDLKGAGRITITRRQRTSVYSVVE